MAAPPVKATILVVDDEIALRQLLARQLRNDGYTVLEAGYGVQALAVARSSPDPIDLVLTDIVMPGMIGTELAQRLVDEHPGIRVVLMSAHAVGGSALPLGRPGSVAVLSKPFDSRRIVALVELILNPLPPEVRPARTPPE
jgi:two-component system, cell cycle sensor histidine kinase and response regulator CckA